MPTDIGGRKRNRTGDDEEKLIQEQPKTKKPKSTRGKSGKDPVVSETEADPAEDVMDTSEETGATMALLTK